MSRQTADVLQSWIRKINEEGRGLSTWELEFMESVTEQFEDRGTLSAKQEEVVERIYAEKTP